MIVRIRLGKGLTVTRARETFGVRVAKRRSVQGFGALLTPAAWMAAALAVWRLAADLQFAGEFGISSGVFSHWQVWLTTAIGLGWVGLSLNRSDRRDDDQGTVS
ncbi:MAG: hypothetical protein ACKV22_27340 [Bryobacteraceae bacterium]